MQTETTEGMICHRKWRHTHLPVKVQVETQLATRMNSPFPPKRDGGYLVFALPGGGEITERELASEEVL